MEKATHNKERHGIGWGWHASYCAVAVVLLIVTFSLIRFESHEARYVDAGHERASHVMDSRMEGESDASG